MYRACSRCGKIHDTTYKCTHNKPKFNNSRYGNQEERKLRNTTKWHKKAEEIKEQAQYLCEVCRDKGVYNYNVILEVHHITKLRADKTRLLDDSNLVCLCVCCHKLADKGLIKKDYLEKLAAKRIKRANR